MSKKCTALSGGASLNHDEIVKAIENIGENIIHIKRIEKIYESKYNETVNYKIMENIYDTLGAEKHKA